MHGIDPEVLTFATPRQREVCQAVIDNGGWRKASRALDMTLSSVQTAYQQAKRRAALRGYAPESDMHAPTASPFVVRGTSTLYDEFGNKKVQWVKTSVEKDQLEQVMREFVLSLAEGVKGKAPKVAAPKQTADELLAVYPMGDPHFGMYAWAEEAGDDFDVEKAESITCAAIERLIASAPDAETALVLPLGDLIHADNSKNATPNSGAVLDVDTRWARVMQVGLRALIYCIQKALAKHKKVIVRIVRGNHDPHASIAISLAIDAYFHGNPRVKVDLSPAAHWYYQFGKVLIGSTHGDTTKEKDLLGVMASDRPREWGDTAYRYWYCGHIHHVAQKEYPGVIVEYFRTLAPKDAWHAGQGYRSGRDMCCIVHHREFGEVERHRCAIGMLKGKS